MSIGPRPEGWHPPALTPAYRSTRLRAPSHPPLAMPPGPAEEAGPVFGHLSLGPLDGDLLVNHAAPGETAIGPRIRVHGTVRDEGGRPVPHALLELWQANAGGRYRHARDGYLAPLDPNFGGCGRVMTDAEGRYAFRTIQPGPYPWPNGGNDWRPMHVHLSLFGHAFAQRLVTQLYFEGDPLTPLCPILNAVPSQAARDRLVARLDMEGTVPMDLVAWRFDVVLRGGAQTPFENRAEGL
ncbi:protocatechuate 3,4-dioxygenase beta subunit [Hasllibacter halocynthiae]|uniref:Protocatechuate 3,4-dioxygenase beta subunit n=1 Tax=Hasllibacter halocynthiae TaxID=595589 RepID=A0A2T0X6V0_9RHOB|nr:protocatechuate 3,4-dioxygenase subunit beta [Hasllibacter halocynthiae]PRY94615.1 protocatechuate 3,4-dioxygenase beta subunit [Hasllibacter halocynthiae]